jgi:hypothetical protein
VVYEVAHAQTADAHKLNTGSTRLKLDRPADEAAATNEFEFLAGSARTTVLDDSERPVVHEASLSASGAHSHRVLQTVEQRAVEIEHREFPIADDSLVVQTGEQTSRPAGDSAVVAAHDAAFEKLEDEFEPIGERQEVAAATVDLHGKRVLGGALIAVAAIPVAKVVRRHGQRPSEARPRRATPAT